MIDDIKISILITAYNAETCISKSIASAINQTYKNIEILVINNASTDKTEEIIKNMINKDNRIKLINAKKKLSCGGR